MKNLIIILFGFFLLASCETTKSLSKSKKVSANEIAENRNIKKDFSKVELYDALGFRYVLDNPFTNAASSQRILEHDVEIIWGVGKNIFYVFKYVSEPVDCGVFKCNQGNGALASWHDTFDEAINSIPKKELTQTEKLYQMPSTTTTNTTTQSLTSNSSTTYDNTKYLICYGEMTNAHKARGLHKSNRALSIQIKETVCKSYANGEHDSYEGKQ